MATIPADTLNTKQREDFLRYAKSCATRDSGALSAFRNLLEYRDKAYQRQLDVTEEHIKALFGNRAGNARKIQNMAVPIVMPQIESAVAYQTGVYLTSYPIFGVVSSADQMSVAQKFELTIADQSIKNTWTRELIKAFRNGFKYNFAPVACLWENTPLQRITTNTTASANAGAAALEQYSYGANRMISCDPYNCFMDMTVAPADMHTKGEYFGWSEVLSKVELSRLCSRLDQKKVTDIRKAFCSPFGGIGTQADAYYVPHINQFLRANTNVSLGTNWGVWAGLAAQNKSGLSHDYKTHYVVTHFICRASPMDFKRPGGYLPKVYYGIIVNWSTVLYVEEMVNTHDYLPVVIMQPMEDGLGYQTQSMLDNGLPFQDMSSALWNVTLESKRRHIFDRLLYNPSMVEKKDIDPTSSIARIPIRNANMARKDINPFSHAIHQIPYTDNSSGQNLQMAEMISGMADQAVGQNRVDRGQFQPGNKTRTEFQQTMTNSNSRQQLQSLVIQDQFMTPVKEIVKSNTLYHQSSMEILNRDSKEMVKVDPIEFRKAVLEFKLTDGLLPMDKIMSPELLTVFMQTAQALPAMQSEYDVLGMFVYWAKLQGATWVDEFKRDQAGQNQFLETLRNTTAATNATAMAPTPAPAA